MTYALPSQRKVKNYGKYGEEVFSSAANQEAGLPEHGSRGFALRDGLLLTFPEFLTPKHP